MSQLDLQFESDLLQRIRSGDAAACNECVEMHYESLRRLALRLVSDPLEAEDVVQEAFLSAFTNIHTFHGRSRLGTWLFRITYNTALMHRRKKIPPMFSVDAAPGAGAEDAVEVQLFDWCCLPEDDFLRNEALDYIDQAVEDLPDSLRQVFTLREFEGLSTAEVAEALNLTENVVKVRLHRARQNMRARLEKYFGRDFSFPQAG